MRLTLENTEKNAIKHPVVEEPNEHTLTEMSENDNDAE